MILYYQTGTGTSESEIFVDFYTLKGMTNLPATTLFRKLRHCKKITTYRNKTLYNYKALLRELPEIYKEIRKSENIK